MKKMVEELGPQGLEVVGVTSYYGYYKTERPLTPDQEFERMQGFVKNEHALPWPVIFGSRENFEKYGVGGIPHITVIGRDGKVHSY
ncbi:MAG TPA: hypothetical protein VM328_10165, partial [Fimbriimonadaceae bacterium]|nr:hypothetical protein [Fimbriimonadaceae bacterium]